VSRLQSRAQLRHLPLPSEQRRSSLR
jgi:hypothetical protein